MYTDVMGHPCKVNTYGRLFFTLLVKAIHVRLDSLTNLSHCTTCVTFFFTSVVNGIRYHLQKIEIANSGKTRIVSWIMVTWDPL